MISLIESPQDCGRARGEIKLIIGNDLKLFLISVLGHHRGNLKRKMYTKQPLRTGRLVEGMKRNNWE